jgi:hypothetical protein
MQFRRQIGNEHLVLECDARFKSVGRTVLRSLTELAWKGPALHAGSTIQFGWSVLTLRPENGHLRICEPDYFGDALHDYRPTLDTTFEVILEQVEVLTAETAEGLDARFDQYVAGWPGALMANDIFLHRRQREGEDNTGWFFGDLIGLEAGGDVGVVENMRVFELLRRRRSIMKVLALPVGYTVVMRGTEIDSIMKG